MTKTTDSPIKVAAELASVNAKQATDLATTAVKTAADLATTTAASFANINTNIEWLKGNIISLQESIKQSLTSIEIKLEEMNKSFVTSLQHQVLVTELEDHEKRLRWVEANNWKLLGAVAVLSVGITVGVGFVLRLIK